MKHINAIRKRKWHRPLLLALLSTFALPAMTQTYIEYNSPVTISNGTTDEYDYILIGPDAVLTIEQDWYVMTQNLYIHPAATITGPGTIHVMDPATFGNLSAMATTIDGGGVPLGVVLSIENPTNILLNTINPNNIIAGLSWTDPGTAGTDHLFIDNTLNLGAAGGDVLLNNSELIFGPSGSYSYSDLNAVDFPGTDPEPSATPDGALLVTNGTGHVVKQGLLASFKFPVGIAEGNYTPATISAPSVQSDFFVQVKSYAQSASTEAAPAEGMDRTWHIFCSTAATASLALQHNISTNGASYADASAFVTRYQGGSLWSIAPLNVDYNGVGDIAGSALHSHSYSIVTASGDNGSFFSKSSDPVSPLPVNWISFDVRQQSNCSVQLEWVTAGEQNSDHFSVERSRDGRNWTAIAKIKAAGNTSATQKYSSLDPDAPDGLLHYRIRQMDINGSAHYSTIRSIAKNCGSNALKVYPTLNKAGVVFVTLPTGYEDAQLRLFNMNGQVAPSKTTGNGLARTVYLQGLPTGEYIIQVINKGKQQSFKVLYLP